MNHQRDFVLKICATSASNPEMNYSRVVHHASFRQINQVLLRHLLLLMAEARELRRSCHVSCKNWKPVTSLQWMGRWRRLCIHVIVFFLVPSSKNRSFRPPLMAIPRSKSKPRIAISVPKWLKIVLRCSKLWANILKTVREGKKPHETPRKKRRKNKKKCPKRCERPFARQAQDEVLTTKRSWRMWQRTSQIPRSFLHTSTGY